MTEPLIPALSDTAIAAYDASPLSSTVQLIAVVSIDESPFNPRKTFTSDGLEELAKSISENALLQPILVRPLTASGRYEVIFGHRRLRAIKLLEKPNVEARVADVTDVVAARMQIAENLQRVDVHAIEEAEGLAALMTDHGVSADELVKQTRKSRSYVYNRVRLARSCDDLKNACLEGRVGAEVATQIARIPGHALQVKALAVAIEKDWRGEGKSFREIRDQLNERFTLNLAQALWSMDDAELVPAAGACRTCPKQSGCAPDLQVDVDRSRYSVGAHGTRADVCTDPDCFDLKKVAFLAADAREISSRGVVLVTGAKARAAIDEYGRIKGQYVAADKELLARVKKLQGDKPKTVTIQDPRTGKTVEALKKADLKAAGLVDEREAATARHAAELRRRQEKAHAATEARLVTFKKVRARIAETERSSFDLRVLLDMALDACDYDDSSVLYEAWEVGDKVALKAMAATLDDSSLARLLLDCALVRNLKVGYWYSDEAKHELLAAAADYYGVAEDAVPALEVTTARKGRSARRPAAQAPERVDPGAADVVVTGVVPGSDNGAGRLKRAVRATPSAKASQFIAKSKTADGAGEVDDRPRPLFDTARALMSPATEFIGPNARVTKTTLSAAAAWPYAAQQGPVES